MGAVGAAAGFGGAILTTPACITGLGCALPTFSALGGTLSFHDGWQATGQLFAPYEYTQGSKVLNSFSSESYLGDVSPMRDYGTAARVALEIVLFKGAAKLANGTGASVLLKEQAGTNAVKGTTTAAKATSSSGTNTVAGVVSNKIDPHHLDLVTVHPNAHSITRHGGSVTDEQLMHRALTAVAPDGYVKISNGKTILPPMSSAFYSDQLLIKVDQTIRNGGALQAAIAKNPGETIITLRPANVGDLGVSVGRGFERIAGSKLNPGL